MTWVATAIWGAAIIGGATAVGTTAYSANASSIEGKKQRKAADDASQAAMNLGDLSGADANASASRRMFREGLYFTSPTGAYGTEGRGRSRLMGT